VSTRGQTEVRASSNHAVPVHRTFGSFALVRRCFPLASDFGHSVRENGGLRYSIFLQEVACPSLASCRADTPPFAAPIFFFWGLEKVKHRGKK